MYLLARILKTASRADLRELNSNSDRVETLAEERRRRRRRREDLAGHGLRRRRRRRPQAQAA
jgi:hypothetical protein